MSKHTPGPWSMHEYDGPCEPYILIKSGSWNIVHNRHSNVDFDVERANARLISAAPDLLALAKQFKDTIEYYIRIDKKSGDIEGANLKSITLHIVNTVIAKAEDQTE